METIYLRNGQKAELIKKVDDQFLVDPYMYFQGYEGEEYEDHSGNVQLVNEVFTTPPRAVLDKEIATLQETKTKLFEQVGEVSQKLNEAERQLHAVKSQKTDLDKFIINRKELREAQRVTVFKKDKAFPTEFNPKCKGGMKLSFTIEMISGREESWVYTLWTDGYRHESDSWSNSDKIDKIMYDATEEDIQTEVKRRASEITSYNDYYHRDIPEEYLPESVLKEKQEAIARNKENSLNKAKKDFEEAKLKYEQALEGTLPPSKRKK